MHQRHAIYNGYSSQLIDNMLNKTKKSIEKKSRTIRTLNKIQNNEQTGSLHIGLALHTINNNCQKQLKNHLSQILT